MPNKATNLDEAKEWFLENPTGDLTCTDKEGRSQICSSYPEAKAFFSLPPTPIKELIAAGNQMHLNLGLALGQKAHEVLQRWEDARDEFAATNPEVESMNLSSRGPNGDSIVHMAFYTMLVAMKEEHPLIERLKGKGLEKVDIRLTVEGIQLPFEAVFENWKSQMDRMIKEEAVEMLEERLPDLSLASENLNDGYKRLVREFRVHLGLPADEDDR